MQALVKLLSHYLQYAILLKNLKKNTEKSHQNYEEAAFFKMEALRSVQGGLYVGME